MHPPEYRCPVTQQIMLFPVLAADGRTYEEEYILQWFGNKANPRSPMTGKELENKTLIPNMAIKSAIDTYLSKHPDYWEDVFFSEKLMRQLLEALAAKNRNDVDRFLAIDKRLLTSPLVDGKSLLPLSCSSSVEILMLVINRLGDKFFTSPEVKEDNGINLFITVASNLGVEGARLIAERLKWQPSDIQREFLKAVDVGNLQLSDICLKLGADVNQLDPSGNAPLHKAVIAKNPALIELLLSNKAEINLPDTKGNTSLHLAAITGSHDIAMLLLQSGANAKAKNTADETPAAAALASKNDALAQAIESKRLELKFKPVLDKNLQIPLGQIQLNKQTLEKQEVVLEDHATQLQERVKKSEFPTLFAEQHWQQERVRHQELQAELIPACKAGDLAKVQILVQQDVDLNLPGVDGKHPLTAALYSMNLELIMYVYAKLNKDPSIMAQCVDQLPHRPQAKDFHKFAWYTLSNLIADEKNFEVRTYVSEWLWRQNKLPLKWTQGVIVTPDGGMEATYRAGDMLKMTRDERAGPSALKYRISSPWHEEQVKCATAASVKCCSFIESQLALVPKHKP